MKPAALLLALLLAACGGTEEPYCSCWCRHPDDWRTVCQAEVKCATYRASDPQCKAIR